MKVLLINTPINLADTLGKFSSIYNSMKMVPIGLASVGGFLREQGIEVSILDQYTECLSLDEVESRIADFGPGIIGYSATTPNYYAAINFARAIRQRFPDIPTVFGGHHPSALPTETLVEDCVDYVIRDEGEHTLHELALALEAGGPLETIHGLSFMRGGECVHNPPRAPLDVDAIPFPAYDLLPLHDYDSPSYFKFASPTYHMHATRGCPFRCSYCINADLAVSVKYRRMAISRVVDQMEMLVDQYGARQLQFCDPMFPLSPKHGIEFAEEIMRRGLHRKVVWNISTRPDILNEEMVNAMAKAGCRGVVFGIETNVPELLAGVHKQFDIDRVREGCRLCRKAGMVVSAGFILGFPGETKEMSQQTIDFSKSLDIHYAQYSILVPYPGTPLYKELKAAGKIDSEREKDYAAYNQNIGNTDLKQVYVPEGRSGDELKACQRRAYREFFLRPKVVWMHLPHITLQRIGGLMSGLLAILKINNRGLSKDHALEPKIEVA